MGKSTSFASDSHLHDISTDGRAFAAAVFFFRHEVLRSYKGDIPKYEIFDHKRHGKHFFLFYQALRGASHQNLGHRRLITISLAVLLFFYF